MTVNVYNFHATLAKKDNYQSNSYIIEYSQTFFDTEEANTTLDNV